MLAKFYVRQPGGEWEHRPMSEVKRMFEENLYPVDVDRAMTLLIFCHSCIQIKLNNAMIKSVPGISHGGK